MKNFIARRVAPDVDIWNLFDGFDDIGCLTRFPGEGPMATVDFCGAKETVAAQTIHATLIAAKAAYFRCIEHAQACFDEGHIEDEDGTIAHMRMMERLNEPFEDHAHEPYLEKIGAWVYDPDNA